MDALEEALVRFSLLAWEQGLAEGEANPLRVTPQGVVALDARFVLGGYIKPVGTLPVWSKEHGLVDQDAFFFSRPWDWATLWNLWLPMWVPETG